MKFKVLLVLSLFVFTSLVNAQPRGQRKKNMISIGAGYAFKDNIRNQNSFDDADEDPISRFIPMAMIKLGPVRIAGPNIEVSLYNNPFFSPFINIKRAGDRYYGPDNLDRRLPSWFTAAGFRSIFFRVSYAKDIQDRSKGSITKISFAPRFPPLKGFMIMPSITAEIWDKEYTNYYYGVSQSEANNDRSAYSPGSTTNWVLGLGTRYIITEKISAGAFFKYKFYGQEVEDSYTTVSSKELSGIFSLTYSIL